MTQFQVKVEGVPIVKVTEVDVPLSGTDPVPDQPVHLYLVPPTWSAGLVTEAVIPMPVSYQCSPTDGSGES